MEASVPGPGDECTVLLQRRLPLAEEGKGQLTGPLREFTLGSSVQAGSSHSLSRSYRDMESSEVRPDYPPDCPAIVARCPLPPSASSAALHSRGCQPTTTRLGPQGWPAWHSVG
jgi:hypothetical protein